jgi:hypothetical protein
MCVGSCVMLYGMDCVGRRTCITRLHRDATGEYGDMSVFVFSSVSSIPHTGLCVHSVMDTQGFVLSTL